jgi:hypothetical protein
VPIVGADIKLYLSGGASNTVPNASLGGARSTTQIVDNVLQNLFDNVSGVESAAGDVEYRCFYVRNEHATLTHENVVAWLSAEIANGASIQIGIDPAGVNGTATTIGDEGSAPAGVSFNAPTTQATGDAIGNMAPNAYQGVWLKRTVGAGTNALDPDGVDVAFGGDTAA